MSLKIRPMIILAVLAAASLACNLPAQGGSGGTQIPAPNQTLTALFAVTPAGTSTPTLPPVVTATFPAAALPTNTLVPAQPTATTAPVVQQPTSTTAPVVQQPTATTAPARPTATIPGVRPRAAVEAKLFTTPPTLDGDWAEWKSISTEYPATNVTYGRESWTGEDDLAGSFHVGWDANNLYIAVKVRDDQYAQNATGENIFKGDSIEILLDTKLQEDFYYNRLSPDDFQLGISPGRPDTGGTKEAYLWFPDNVAGARTGVQIASRAEAGVYRVEAAIPWSVFEVRPTEGMHMGFALSISDNDNTGSNIQQTMVSNVSNRHLTDPTTWGDLRLSR